MSRRSGAQWKSGVAQRALAVSAALTLAVPALAQDVMRGHGGPVRALAVKADTRELVSGSFDSTVIVWDLDRGVAKRVLRFHDGPVNAVAVLGNGCIASGGEDRRVAIWCGSDGAPTHVLSGHEAPISALAVTGVTVMAGAMDGAIRAWDGLPPRPVEAAEPRKGAVTGISFIPDSSGRAGGLAIGGADGAVALLAPHVDEKLQFASAVSAVAASKEGLAVAGNDGVLRLVGRGRVVTDIEVESIPLSSLAVSPDGRLIATAGLRGGIAVVDRESRKVIHRLTGPGLPVWSLVFDSDSRTLISGGADRVIRRWDAIEGRAITSALPERDIVAEAVASGERGAVVFRACQACHTLSPDDGNRAGPTLHGIMGRRIATAQGYRYSEALRGMEIVWSKETIARLFELGPNAYTPGTKMPEQTITSAEDRRALVDWLDRVTR